MRALSLVLTLAALMFFSPACGSGGGGAAVVGVCMFEGGQAVSSTEVDCAANGGAWAPPTTSTDGGTGGGDPLPCVPACDGRACGSDGCGATCGTCADGSVCDAVGACVLLADCTDSCTDMMMCGEVCGVSCGTCPEDYTCNVVGLCEAPETTDPSDDCEDPDSNCEGGTDGCTPQCSAKNCGDDGCGGNCGTCAGGQVCNLTGQCVAMSDCSDTCASMGWACDSVCGETCGVCAGQADTCQEGACVCVAYCIDMECGDDGCGGSCGTCAEGTTCNGYYCEEPCEASCVGKVCGDDGCGGSCGVCGVGEDCVANQCQAATCTPSCTGKQCGDDGCGGTCGMCVTGQTCSAAGLCEGEGVGGGASCMDTYECMGGCGQDQVCAQQCQSLASAQAMAELQSFLGCVGTCQDLMCYATQCSVEMAECFFDIHGTSSCGTVLTCLNGCGGMDTACQDGCINQGTLAAQADFLAISVCIQAVCPDTSDNACIQAAAGPGGACAAIFAACQ